MKLLPILILVIVISACSPTEVPQVVETLEPTPTVQPTSSPIETVEPTPIQDSRIDEWDDASSELTLVNGDRFEYWSYAQQQWVTVEVVATYPLTLNMPAYLSIFDDPMFFDSKYMMVGEEHQFSPNGVLTYFWVEGLGDSIKVSAGGKKRLRLIPRGADA